MLDFADKYHLENVHFHNINPHGDKSVSPLFVEDAFYFSSILLKNNYKNNIDLPYLFRKGDIKTKCLQPWYYHCFDPDFNLAFCCQLKHRKGLDMDQGRFIMKTWMNSTVDCLYCQRRFMGRNYAIFNSNKKKWRIYN